LAVERDVWRPIHEERMRRGLLAGWSLYQVLFAPPDASYNYATVNVFTDFAQLDGAASEVEMAEIMAAAHPGADVDALMERTMASREIVHTEV
ncbi:MAG: hypothetical protein R3362_07180, partial [Rhodothermales bacterium]|nr:hypothetical protein [Rhodothermales bacterium]